jgi:hypothetical protein
MRQNEGSGIGAAKRKKAQHRYRALSLYAA